MGRLKRSQHHATNHGSLRHVGMKLRRRKRRKRRKRIKRRKRRKRSKKEGKEEKEEKEEKKKMLLRPRVVFARHPNMDRWINPGHSIPPKQHVPPKAGAAGLLRVLLRPRAVFAR